MSDIANNRSSLLDIQKEDELSRKASPSFNRRSIDNDDASQKSKEEIHQIVVKDHVSSRNVGDLGLNHHDPQNQGSTGHHGLRFSIPKQDIDTRKVSDIHSKILEQLHANGGNSNNNTSPASGKLASMLPNRERTFSMVQTDDSVIKDEEEMQRRLLLTNPPPPFQRTTLFREESPPPQPPRIPPLSEIFGGLILGLGGQKSGEGQESAPPVSAPEDYTYRGIIFREGINLASDYPGGDELKMTPFCIPNTRRIKDMARPYTDIGMHFSPTSTLGKHGSGQQGEAEKEKEKVEETEGEGGNETDPNIFIFFGDPPKIKPTDCPPLYASSYDQILEFIDEHNIEMLLEHLLALCLISLPANPFEFIAEHVGKMIEARNDPEKFNELTRVFYPDHVHAMFRVFDKEQTGSINLSQYTIGMQALGLVRYTQQPKGYKTNIITEEIFVREACQALDVLLKSFMN